MPLKRKLPSKLTQEDVLKRDVYADDVPPASAPADEPPVASATPEIPDAAADPAPETAEEAAAAAATDQENTAEEAPIRRRERGAARAQQMSQRVQTPADTEENEEKPTPTDTPQATMDAPRQIDAEKQAAILSDLKGQHTKPAEDVTEAAFISPEEDNILPTPGFSLAKEPKAKATLQDSAPEPAPQTPTPPKETAETPLEAPVEAETKTKTETETSAPAQETTAAPTAETEEASAQTVAPTPPKTAESAAPRPKGALKRKTPQAEPPQSPSKPPAGPKAPPPAMPEPETADTAPEADIPPPPPVPDVKPKPEAEPKKSAEEELPPLAPGWGPPPLPSGPKDPLASPSGYDPLSDSKWSRFAKKEDVLPEPGEPFVPPEGTPPPGEGKATEPAPDTVTDNASSKSAEKPAETGTEKDTEKDAEKPQEDEKPLPPLPDFGKDMFAGGGGFPSFPGGDMFGGGGSKKGAPSIPKPKVYVPDDDDDELPPEPEESEYGPSGPHHKHDEGHAPPELPNGDKKSDGGGGGFRKGLTIAILLALVVGAVVLLQDGENTQSGRTNFADLQEAPPTQSTGRGSMPAPASPIAELDAAALPTPSPTASSADIDFVDVSQDEANQPVVADGTEDMPEELSTIAKLQNEIERLKEQKEQQEEQRVVEEVLPTKQQIQAELDAYREALAQAQTPEEMSQANEAARSAGQRQSTRPVTRTTAAPAGLPPGKVLENPYNLPTIPEPEENAETRVRTLEDFELEMFTPERDRVRIPNNIRPRLSATDYPQLELLSVVPEQGIIAAHKGREGVLLLGESIEGWQLVGVFTDYAEFRNGQRKYILRFN